MLTAGSPPAEAANEPRPDEPAGAGTRLCDLRLRIGGSWRTVGLKLEQDNRGGSIKDRTAHALIDDLERSGRLSPGGRLVESTSGNLGVALAMISRERGYRFTAVIDPKVDPVVVSRMREAGAEIVQVDTMDPGGGYLLTRLAEVQRLVESQGMAWPNQYSNPANPRAHFRETAPELLAQRPEIDAVFVAVSTGGTLAGIGRFFKQHRPEVRIVGVDVAGSVVFGGPPAPRLLNGIGSSRTSSFLTTDLYDDYRLVEDRQAIAACHLVRTRTGVGLGGSSGAVLVACAAHLGAHPWIRHPVCICPDGSSNYLNTLYSTRWLADRGVYPQEDIAALPFAAPSV